MATNASIIQVLGKYFASKGGVMSYVEYRDAEDAPIRPVVLKRAIGPWTRLLALIGDLSQYEEAPEDVKKTKS